MDEAFFMYGEDLDWAYRVKQAGYKVWYHPAVTVHHVKRAASGKSPKAQFEFWRAMLIFYRKHFRRRTIYPVHLMILMALLFKGRSWLMAGNPQPEPYSVAPRSIRLSNDHLKALSTLTLLLADTVMLIVAFVVGYEAREVLPFFPRPEEQPALSRYLPTILLHTATIVVMFYFSQLYHLKRAFSRIEQLRNVIGVVTLGTLLASGTQEFLLQNTPMEAVYPRSLLFYVWFFSVVLTVAGRELHRRGWNIMRRRGVVRDNLLIVGEGDIAHKITEHIRNSPGTRIHHCRNRHRGRKTRRNAWISLHRRLR